MTIFDHESIHTAIFGVEQEAQQNLGKIGSLVKLQVDTFGKGNRDLKKVFNLLAQVVELEHAEIFFNSLGRPVGYIIWAFSESDSTDELGRIWFSKYRLDDNPGIYIVDFSIKKHNIRQILRFLHSKITFIPQFVKYAKQSSGRVSYKIIQSDRILQIERRLRRKRETDFPETAAATINADAVNSKQDSFSNFVSVLKQNAERNQLVDSYSWFKATQYLGEAFYVIASDAHKDMTDRQALDIIWPSVKLGLFRRFLDVDGTPRAILVFAFLSSYSLENANTMPVIKLHRFSFDDGETFSVLLSSGQPDGVESLLAHCLQEHAVDSSEVFYYPDLTRAKAG